MTPADLGEMELIDELERREADEREAHKEQIRGHTEDMPLDQLIIFVSERVTHVTLDWVDGACRAEMRGSNERWIGRGPCASVALARALLLHDEKRQRHVKYVDSNPDGTEKVDRPFPPCSRCGRPLAGRRVTEVGETRLCPECASAFGQWVAFGARFTGRGGDAG